MFFVHACCDPQNRLGFWLEFSARFSLAGRAAETHKSIEVHGRAEDIHHQSERGRYDRFAGLPQSGISQTTHFNWKKKHANILPTDMKRLS
jgi:hypothetical protein